MSCIVYLYWNMFSGCYNYSWLFSQRSFALLTVARDGCSGVCGNICSAAGLLVDWKTFYIDKKLLLSSSCWWNADSGTRRVIFPWFVWCFFSWSCSRSWFRAEIDDPANHAQELSSSQMCLLFFSHGWKQRRFTASLSKVLQRLPSAAACVRRERHWFKMFKVSA